MTRFVVDVAVDTDGLVSVTPVGFPVEPWLGLQAMPVTGGVLQIDARHPETGIRCFVTAPEVSEWIVPLFGPDVTREVVRLSLLLDPHEQSAAFSIDSGPFYDRTVRLIYGLWLRRWWPSPVGAIPAIEQWLLDIELGDLAAGNEQLFDGTDPAVDLLAPHTPRLAAAVDAYVGVQGANAIEDAIGAVLLSAATTTLAHVDESESGYEQLEDALLRHSAIDEQIGQLPVGAAFDFALAELAAELSGSAQLRELSQARDTSAAPAATLVARGSSPLDWVQVHPRCADAGAAAVVWSVVENADGRTIVIKVLAEHRRPDDRLFARVEMPDGGTLATALSTDEDGYSAVVALPDDCDNSQVRVSVYSAEFGSGARRGSNTEVVRTVRKLVIDIVGARVAAVRRMATGDQRDGDIAAFAAEKRAIRPA